MSMRGQDVVDRWISDNVTPEAYQPDGENSRARELADVMMAEAALKGIARVEIEEEVGDVVAFISQALKDKTDSQVRRLADKDN